MFLFSYIFQKLASIRFNNKTQKKKKVSTHSLASGYI